MSTYAEKAAAFGAPTAYPVQSYGNEDYYRQAQPQAYVQTTYPQGQVAYGAQTQTYAAVPTYTQPQVYNYAAMPQQDNRDNRMASFNPGAPPPNFNRPPPHVGKSDEAYQAAGNPLATMLKNSTTGYPTSASLSMFDAAQTAAQSSAAYTASWVSSTSSIPPDLQDTPEGSTSAVSQIVGDFGQWNNPETQHTDDNLTNGAQDVYTSSATGTHSMQEQFSNMNVGDQQKNYENNTNAWTGAKADAQSATQLADRHWPGLGQAPEKSAKDKKKEEKDRKNKEAARELTWEERLKKAQGAKERAENPRLERNGEKDDKEKVLAPRQEDAAAAARGGKTTERRRGNGRKTTRNENETENGAQPQQNRDQRFNGQRKGQIAPEGGEPQQQLQQPHQQPMHPHPHMNFHNMRGGRGMPRGGPMGPMPPQGPPMMMFRGGPPPHPSMMPPPFMPPGAPVPPMLPPQPPQQQDQRFKHSWLDANLFVPPFQMPYPPMMPPMMGMRGRGGRGMMRGGPAGRGRGGQYKRPNSYHADESEKKHEEGSPAPASAESSQKEQVEKIEETTHEESPEKDVSEKTEVESKEASPVEKFEKEETASKGSSPAPEAEQ